MMRGFRVFLLESGESFFKIVYCCDRKHVGDKFTPVL